MENLKGGGQGVLKKPRIDKENVCRPPKSLHTLLLAAIKRSTPSQLPAGILHHASIVAIEFSRNPS